MLVGNYLNNEEVKTLINTFSEKTKFRNLIQEMNNSEKFEFDENSEVIQAIKFDVLKGEDVYSAKVVYLKLNENVKIRYTIRHLNGDESTTNDFFIGEIFKVEEDEIKVTHFRSYHDEYVSSLISSHTHEVAALAIESNKLQEEQFPIDENYVPGMLLNEEVKTAAWYSGCMPGGYMWCGEGCGGSSACKSTAGAVNSLDFCCKSHDCCYHTYGVSYKNCLCDSNLCDCSQRVPWQFSTPIVQAAMCSSCK